MSDAEKNWRVVDRGGDGVVDIDAPHDQFGWGTVVMSVDPERARRIVACVNAFDGLSTDDIENMANVPEFFFKHIELLSQRDKLLEALNDLLDVTNDPPDPNCSCHIAPPCADCLDNGATRDAISAARAAIAEVEKT